MLNSDNLSYSVVLVLLRGLCRDIADESKDIRRCLVLDKLRLQGDDEIFQTVLVSEIKLTHEQLSMEKGFALTQSKRQPGINIY